MKFSIIGAIDQNNGIGKDNKIPWLSKYNDLAYFKKVTTECDSQYRKNVIIMGKNTWISIGKKDLPQRYNYIISKTLTGKNVFKCLDDCLFWLTENLLHKINRVFIIGGSQLYEEAIAHPDCTQLYITQIPGEYQCDRFFPKLDTSIYEETTCRKDYNQLEYHVYNKINQINMEEYQYIKLIKNVIHNGYLKEDRTNTGTYSIFGNQMRFNLENNTFPLLTTKRVFLRGIIEELLWFINGSTDSKILSNKNVKIWDANGSREFLDNLGFTSREEGDLGPVYGFQWRNWGAEYLDNKSNYTNKGIDQLANLIADIKKNPNSRRLILSAWNVADIPKMALPPCHILCQFYIVNNKISVQLYQRSGDIGLGVPFNIASYALLLIMIAHITNYAPHELIYTLGDAHIYNNHIDALKKQILRIPKKFPKLYLKNVENINTINDFTIDNFDVQNYVPYKNIKMEMAV